MKVVSAKELPCVFWRPVLPGAAVMVPVGGDNWHVGHDLMGHLMSELIPGQYT